MKQLCPKCNGQGIISKPPWIAGDITEWTSDSAVYICNLCNGGMVIDIPNPDEPNPQDFYDWQRITNF